MFLLIAGLAVLGVTIGVFVALLPRGGQRHRFVETALEPYIGVAICAGVALGSSMALSGLINLLGSA
jgi:hypothetical protein